MIGELFGYLLMILGAIGVGFGLWHASGFWIVIGIAFVLLGCFIVRRARRDPDLFDALDAVGDLLD